MRIPGEKRSPFPDDCGNRAGEFAEAVRDGDMNLAWSMLSKETRGFVFHQGSEMMIQVDPETGALQGAADPRRDGYAVGW